MISWGRVQEKSNGDLSTFTIQHEIFLRIVRILMKQSFHKQQ